MAKATKSSKLLKALNEGNELSVKQITSRFKLANPRAAISSLRDDGVLITSRNSVKDSTVKYSIPAAARKKT